jgi:hypothetical protein
MLFIAFRKVQKFDIILTFIKKYIILSFLIRQPNLLLKCDDLYTKIRFTTQLFF